MKALYGLLAMAAYGGITYYIGWNLKVWLQTFQIYRWPWLFWIVLFVVSFGFIIGRIHPLLTPFNVLGNYWMFILQYGLVLCVVANVLVKFTPLTTKLVGTGIMGILVALFVMGTYYAYSPVVREATIHINKRGEDMRVVVASDFHLGILSNKHHLQKFVTLSNEAKPDLVLLVGDLVDDDPKRFINTGMGDVMKQLTATYGIYGVLGNHEYYGNEIPRVKQAMAEANVRILMDETISVENRFTITGREDRTNKNRLSLEELTPANKEMPWFVMDHTPLDLDIPAKLGADLHVSGHTHKGQMWPNHLVTEKVFELDYGYKLKDSMYALVSSGFGFWGPPMRIGSQSELWVVDVQFTNE